MPLMLLSVVPHPAVRNAYQQRMGVEALSERERQVLDAYIVHGDQRPIAAALGIAPQTVKNYITSILDKLDCASSLQAAVLYDRWRRAHVWPEIERRGNGERRGADRRHADRRCVGDLRS